MRRFRLFSIFTFDFYLLCRVFDPLVLWLIYADRAPVLQVLDPLEVDFLQKPSVCSVRRSFCMGLWVGSSRQITLLGVQLSRI